MSIAGVTDWREITPNRHQDWIEQRDEAFQSLLAVGSKEAKASRADDAIFKLFSNGYKSGRDVYVYNFSRDACAGIAQAMVEEYQCALQMLNEDHEENPKRRYDGARRA